MATIVLSAAGNAIAPGFGGFLGAAIGSYIDNAFLFPPPDSKGPRIDSMSIGSSSEGSPVAFLMGPENRVPGNNIWNSKIREDAHEQGKGGPSGTTYTYSVDVAFQFGVAGKTANSIKKLWANGSLIYNSSPDIDYTSNAVSAAVITENRVIFGGIVPVYFTEITSPLLGPDLSLFRAGKNIVVSGWSSTQLNGTFRVVSSSIDEVTGISKVRYKNANAVVDAGGESVTLHQTLPTHSPKILGSATMYLGDTNQLPDPLIQATEGVARTPGFRDEIYCVLENLQLAEFGNQIPQIQALIEVDSAPIQLSDALLRICLRTGLSASKFDTSAVTGLVRGYSVRGPQSIRQQLLPLLFAYDILTVEDNGVLRFFNRVDAFSHTIKESELACHEPGNDFETPFKANDKPKRQLYREVVVNYADPDSDYQIGSQSSVRNDASSDQTLTVDLGFLVLSSDDVANIAKRLLWQAWANKKTYTLSLPITNLAVTENDKLVVPYNGRNYRMLSRKVDRGQNFILEIEAVSEEDQVYTNITSEPPAPTNSEFYIPPEMLLQLLDLPPLRDEDVANAGCYIAACAYEYLASFQGATVYKSTNSGASYSAIKAILSETIIGRCTTTLGNALPAYFDRTNTVTVQIYHSTLSSADILAVLSGTNCAVVGKEVIGYTTATLIAENTFTLSGTLTRGLLETQAHTGTHVANEIFVLLDPGTLSFATYSQSLIGVSNEYKCVPQGGQLSDYDADSLTLYGVNLRPYSPTDLVGIRDASSNLTLTWQRRTRRPVQIFGTVGIPLDEQSEQYIVECLDPSNNVVRTITVNAATTTTYSATDMTTDGLTVSAVKKFRLYQVSAVVGLSLPSEIYSIP